MLSSNRPYFFLSVLALVAVSTLALTGAFAGDEVAPKSDVPAAADAPATKAETPATKTPTPVHTMMGWMAKTVVGDVESPCPSCPDAEKAWRSWFDGDQDVPLAGLRDRLVADGWTADRYISYFKQMAAAHAQESGGCDDCPSKGECGDCPSKASGKGCCGDCQGKAAGTETPSKGGCDSCPGGCPDQKATEPEPETEGTAAK